jgi:hypothetical protein
MKRVPEPTTSPGDDLDALLRAYFRAQMPAPWPAFRAPGKARLLPFRGREARGTSPWVGRAVLVAASLFLLAAMALMPRPNTTGADRIDPLPTIGPPSAGTRIVPPGAGFTKPGRLTPDRPAPAPRPEHDGGHTGFKIPVDD